MSGKICAWTFEPRRSGMTNSYMEVAVHLHSFPAILRLFGVSFLCIAGMLAAGGCAEVVTYAGQDRQQGIRLYNEGQYPEAAGSFKSAIKQRPQDYESYYYLARTHEAMGNFHQAVSEYRTVLTLMSNSLRGSNDRAFRMKAIDGMASAISAGKDITLEQAAFARTNGPTTAEDFLIVAKVRRLDGDVDSALAEYAKAASMEPDNHAIAKEYGLYLVQLNQRKLALAQLQRAYSITYRKRLPEDEEVNQGLRAIGVIPGPSLANVRDLRKPPIPVGPLPEVKLGEDQAAAVEQ